MSSSAAPPPTVTIAAPRNRHQSPYEQAVPPSSSQPQQRKQQKHGGGEKTYDRRSAAHTSAPPRPRKLKTEIAVTSARYDARQAVAASDAQRQMNAYLNLRQAQYEDQLLQQQQIPIRY